MATVGLRGKPLSTAARREAVAGYLFISPWLIGFLVFILGPIIASFYLSLTEYAIIQPPTFVGFALSGVATGR